MLKKGILYTIWTLFLATGLLFLYGKQNRHPNNTCRSSIQFVYQQF